MWNFFRKRPERPPSITDAPPLRRTEAVLKGMAATIPNGHAQILVALANVKIMYEVHRDVIRKKKGEDFTLDDFIRMLEGMLPETKEEIPRRRIMWFMTAAMIHSIGDGGDDPEVKDRLAQIYIHLAEASEMMLDILRHNALWSDDEKIFFTDKYSASRKGTMLIYLPKNLRNHPRIQTYRKAHDFWL